MRGAELSGADLRRANLRGARLATAILSFTKLKGADLLYWLEHTKHANERAKRSHQKRREQQRLAIIDAIQNKASL